MFLVSLSILFPALFLSFVSCIEDDAVAQDVPIDRHQLEQRRLPDMHWFSGRTSARSRSLRCRPSPLPTVQKYSGRQQGRQRLDACRQPAKVTSGKRRALRHGDRIWPSHPSAASRTPPRRTRRLKTSPAPFSHSSYLSVTQLSPSLHQRDS